MKHDNPRLVEQFFREYQHQQDMVVTVRNDEKDAFIAGVICVLHTIFRPDLDDATMTKNLQALAEETQCYLAQRSQ